jgi:hypothetical protein
VASTSYEEVVRSTRWDERGDGARVSMRMSHRKFRLWVLGQTERQEKEKEMREETTTTQS